MRRQSLKSEIILNSKVSIDNSLRTHRRRQERQRTSSCRDLFLMEDQEDLPSSEIAVPFIPASDAKFA